MATISDYLNYSEIDSSAGFVQAQADQLISEGWEVVSQSSDALYGSSGFSVTLFHNAQTNIRVC